QIYLGENMQIQNLLDNLTKRGFKPFYFDDKKDAVDFALNLIPQTASVGIGGSMTVKELGLDNTLAERGNTVYSHALVSPELRDKVYQLAGSADWYISSANALSQEGDVVNIDGSANRISALAFGVKNILYVLGTNKIAPDLASAIDRARNVAAPPNAKRLNKNMPCATSGQCCLCDSEDCICNATLISHHPTRYQENVYIVIIGESLGY
ncbi:MAG: lactate utilization protein, partial [Clostridia bacterium]|nr:lactate utilization protein [Clostridia bacterium]